MKRGRWRVCRRSPGAGPVPGHRTLGRDSVMPAGACQLWHTPLSNKCFGGFQLKRGPMTPRQRQRPLPTFVVVLSCGGSHSLKTNKTALGLSPCYHPASLYLAHLCLLSLLPAPLSPPPLPVSGGCQHPLHAGFLASSSPYLCCLR